MVLITCPEYFEDVRMCFDICVFTVVCVRSLSSEDNIIVFMYTVGKYSV